MNSPQRHPASDYSSLLLALYVTGGLGSLVIRASSLLENKLPSHILIILWLIVITVLLCILPLLHEFFSRTLEKIPKRMVLVLAVFLSAPIAGLFSAFIFATLLTS